MRRLFACFYLLCALSIAESDYYDPDYDYYEDSDYSGKKRQKPEPDFPRWSLSFGIGGSGNSEGSELQGQLDLGYRWTTWMQSIVGVHGVTSDVRDDFVGGRVSQRVFANLGKFSPFLSAGFLVMDFSEAEDTSALTGGGGLQIKSSPGVYAEIFAYYVYREPFTKGAKDFWSYGVSSGLRF